MFFPFCQGAHLNQSCKEGVSRLVIALSSRSLRTVRLPFFAPVFPALGVAASGGSGAIPTHPTSLDSLEVDALPQLSMLHLRNETLNRLAMTLYGTRGQRRHGCLKYGTG